MSLTTEQYFINIAMIASKREDSYSKKKEGCCIVDVNGLIVSTGFNHILNASIPWGGEYNIHAVQTSHT